MQEWPKWLYKDGAARLCRDAQAAADLGKGWAENPSGAVEPPGAGKGAVSATGAVAATYVPILYPKVLYRAIEGQVVSCRVATAEAEAALDLGWAETPNAPASPSAAPGVSRSGKRSPVEGQVKE